MTLPLIITDSEGTLIYISSGLSVSDAMQAWLRATASKENCGRISYGRKNFYVKKLILAGKRLFFFMDNDLLINCFGVYADRAADHLFATDIFVPDKEDPRRTCSLQMLTQMFLNSYSEELRSDGVRVSVYGLLSDVTVSVPPRAFALSLTLMVRLCAESSRTVRLSFVNENNRVCIFADSMGGEPLKTEVPDVLRILLYEVSAAAGFAVHEQIRGGKRGYALELTPLDISLLGFKSPNLEACEKLFVCYAKMF